MAHGTSPFHLGRVPHELTSKSTEHRVGVFDVDPFSNTAPDDFERDATRHRQRSASKQGILSSPVIKNRNVESLEGGETLAEVYFDTIGCDRQSPKQAGRMDLGWIHIMDLCARTGLVDVNSDQRKSTMMSLPVGSSEDAFHEAHVGVHKRKGADLAVAVLVCVTVPLR
jgi:hypothetical protein